MTSIILKKRQYQLLKRHLRRLSMYLPAAREALIRNRRKVIVGITRKGKHKFRYVNVCDKCQKVSNEVEIDHKVEVSSMVSEVSASFNEFDLGAFCEAVLIAPDGFDILCVDCHSLKTKGFMRSRGNKGRLL